MTINSLEAEHYLLEVKLKRDQVPSFCDPGFMTRCCLGSGRCLTLSLLACVDFRQRTDQRRPNSDLIFRLQTPREKGTYIVNNPLIVVPSRIYRVCNKMHDRTSRPIASGLKGIHQLTESSCRNKKESSQVSNSLLFVGTRRQADCDDINRIGSTKPRQCYRSPPPYHPVTIEYSLSDKWNALQIRTIFEHLQTGKPHKLVGVRNQTANDIQCHIRARKRTQFFNRSQSNFGIRTSSESHQNSIIFRRLENNLLNFRQPIHFALTSIADDARPPANPT